MPKNLTNAPVLETQLVTYRFNISNEDESRQYRDLVESLKAQGLRCFNVLAVPSETRKPCESGPVHLATNYLFENQWNTTASSPTNPDFRVFDWYEGIVPNRDIKAGHYLVVTDEMREIREKVLKCGFCGALHWEEEGKKMCDECISSPYLSEERLFLLRLVPVSRDRQDRSDFSDDEKLDKEALEAAFEEAQVRMAEERCARERDEALKDYASKRETIDMERDGLLWLADRKISTENCIFYAHSRRFCFGWRQALDERVKKRLSQELADFPFRYELK